MNKFKFKFISIGIIIGIMISITIPTFAEMQPIQAYFNDIKININGKIINTGTDKPFIYNSRTYLPARYLAEGLGASVKWNETSNTVEIDSPVQTQTPEIVTPIITPTSTVDDFIKNLVSVGGAYIKIDDKIYDYGKYSGYSKDLNGKYYADPYECINILAVGLGDYKIFDSNKNPFLNGTIDINKYQYYKVVNKYIAVNNYYPEWTFNNKDKTKIYPSTGSFSYKEVDKKGMVGYRMYIYMCLNDMLDYFDIKYKLEVNADKMFVISFQK